MVRLVSLVKSSDDADFARRSGVAHTMRLFCESEARDPHAGTANEHGT